MKKWLSVIFLSFCLSACQSGKEQPATESDIDATTAATENTPPQNSSEISEYPPAPDLPPAPDTLKIAVISDINGSYGTIGYSPTVKAAVKDIIQGGYDFVVSPGDLVAGQKPGLDYDAMWKAFHYEIDDVFFDNNLEFIFAPGNHDASAYSQHAPERVHYEAAFKSRKPKADLIDGSHFPFYYGVVIRDVRVIALDITRPINNEDPQIDWLESVLSNDYQPRTTIVLGHLPLTPINPMQFWETAGSTRLVDILKKSPNTIYISGHHHIFYPGHIGELRTIASPALGSGPKSLIGTTPLAGYLQIVIPPQAPPRVYGLVAPDFKRMTNISLLPKVLFRLEREDVGMAEYIMEMLDDDAKKIQ